MVQEAKIVQQWGAFYLTRKALDIPTQSEHWLAEAGRIIVKITAVVIAVFFDILTGVMYLIFVFVKTLIVVLAKGAVKVLTALIEKILTVLAYLLALVLTIAILYFIITHWQWFTAIIEKLSVYAK